VAIPVGLLVVVLLIVISLCAVFATRVAAEQTARKDLKVMPFGSSVTSDWRLSSRGAIATDDRTTQIRVQLTRASDAAQTPRLTGNFDGSGGGDAKLVTCSARPAKWTVPNGSSQTIPLTCNAILAPAVVRQIQYVYAGAQA
jgi:hypothetical protein